jgi:hypothetical protein
MRWVEGHGFTLLYVVLHSNVPVMGTTKVHDQLMVLSKGPSTHFTMVEMNSFFCRPSGCMPVNGRYQLFIAPVKGLGREATIGIMWDISE